MTYPDLLAPLPDDAPCWIYVAERPLSDPEQAALLADVRGALADWTSHGRTVVGDAVLLHGRFLVVSGMIPDGEISGCGIDASVHAVHAAAARLGLTWLSPLQVFFRDAHGQVTSASRRAFREHVQAGTVTAETPVFDVSLTRLGPVRGGSFERPAGQSWHARVFRIPVPAA